MKSSIAIIGGNEPFPECFVAGYRTAFNQFAADASAEYNLRNIWGIDQTLMRTAMRQGDEQTIKRIINGCYAESSLLEFPYVAFAAPEMYYWEQKLEIYPQRGQLIRIVPAVKLYINTQILPKCKHAHLGVIGSNDSIRLFTELPDIAVATRQLRYQFYSPNPQLLARITSLRLANAPSADLHKAHELCVQAIDDILENYLVDGIILADLETERWLKHQTYVEHLTEIASHRRVALNHYSHKQQRQVFVLSAIQSLISHVARYCSYSRVPDIK